MKCRTLGQWQSCSRECQYVGRVVTDKANGNRACEYPRRLFNANSHSPYNLFISESVWREVQDLGSGISLHVSLHVRQLIIRVGTGVHDQLVGRSKKSFSSTLHSDVPVGERVPAGFTWRYSNIGEVTKNCAAISCRRA
jgi:hypothetical protein